MKQSKGNDRRCEIVLYARCLVPIVTSTFTTGHSADGATRNREFAHGVVRSVGDKHTVVVGRDEHLVRVVKLCTHRCSITKTLARSWCGSISDGVAVVGVVARARAYVRACVFVCACVRACAHVCVCVCVCV